MSRSFNLHEVERMNAWEFTIKWLTAHFSGGLRVGSSLGGYTCHLLYARALDPEQTPPQKWVCVFVCVCVHRAKLVFLCLFIFVNLAQIKSTVPARMTLVPSHVRWSAFWQIVFAETCGFANFWCSFQCRNHPVSQKAIITRATCKPTVGTVGETSDHLRFVGTSEVFPLAMMATTINGTDRKSNTGSHEGAFLFLISARISFLTFVSIDLHHHPDQGGEGPSIKVCCWTTVTCDWDRPETYFIDGLFSWSGGMFTTFFGVFQQGFNWFKVIWMHGCHFPLQFSCSQFRIRFHEFVFLWWDEKIKVTRLLDSLGSFVQCWKFMLLIQTRSGCLNRKGIGSACGNFSIYTAARTFKASFHLKYCHTWRKLRPTELWINHLRMR